MTAGTGNRTFARYAHAPNALGYCGPAGASLINDVASGRSTADLREIARKFSGAWPYQSVLAEAAGREDPMEEAVVRGYWTGNDVTSAVDRRVFGETLLARIKPQAGHYWAHLDEGLLDEAAPTHAFHVLSVYPWSRLLPTGRAEPLFVLDSCRITWGTVQSVGDETLTVVRRPLAYDDGSLRLAAPSETEVSWRKPGQQFIDEPSEGDIVAIHWGNVCDVLTRDQADALKHWTLWQLEAVAPRLHRASPRECDELVARSVESQPTRHTHRGW